MIHELLSILSLVLDVLWTPLWMTFFRARMLSAVSSCPEKRTSAKPSSIKNATLPPKSSSRRTGERSGSSQRHGQLLSSRTYSSRKNFISSVRVTTDSPATSRQVENSVRFSSKVGVSVIRRASFVYTDVVLEQDQDRCRGDDSHTSLSSSATSSSTTSGLSLTSLSSTNTLRSGASWKMCRNAAREATSRARAAKRAPCLGTLPNFQ